MINQAQPFDAATAGKLAAELWPHHTPEEMTEDLLPLLSRDDAAVFLAWEENTPVGFAQCQLRRDYVEGTSTSPVAYLEGIYVRETSRGRGIACRLLAACQNWAKEQGCAEFASDCELSNKQSLLFHKAVGFQETNRIICFTKQL